MAYGTVQRATRGYPTQGYRGGSQISATRGGFQNPLRTAANDIRGVIESPANANPRLGANIKPLVRTFGNKIATTVETPAGRFAMRTALRLGRVNPAIRTLFTLYDLYDTLNKTSASARTPALPAVEAGYSMAGWTLVDRCFTGPHAAWGRTQTAACLNGQAGVGNPLTAASTWAQSWEYYFGLAWRYRVRSRWSRPAQNVGTIPEFTGEPDRAAVPAKPVPGAAIGLQTGVVPSIPWALIPYRVSDPLSDRGYHAGKRHKPHVRHQPNTRPMRRADRHRYEPPGPRTREKKSVAKTPAVILSAISKSTDALEWVDVAYAGLDPRIRKRLEAHGNKLNPLEKTKAVYDHFKWFSIERFLQAAVANVIEDRFYGTLGQIGGKASNNLGLHGNLPFGSETGIADSAFGDMLNEYRKAENDRREKAGEQKLDKVDVPYVLDFKRQVDDFSGDVRKFVVSVTSR